MKKKVFLLNNYSQQVLVQKMQNKSISHSKRPPPKSSTLTPKAASSSSQSVNTFKDKKEEVRPDDSQTLQKKINELLQLKFSTTIDEKVAGEKIKKMFDPLKPTDLKKCFQQCARVALDIKPTKLKDWKEKTMKIIAEASQQLEKSKQYLKLTNKKKQQSQILPQEDDQEQKGQYNNLMMKKKKQDIIEDYKRIRKHDTLLQRIIQGQILINFTKLYKIIPLQRRVINQQNEEHYDPQGIKQLENICKADDIEPIQISTIEQLLIREKRMSTDIKRYLQNIAEEYQKIQNIEKNMKKAMKNNQLEQSFNQLIKLWILIQNNLNIINISLFLRLIKLNKQTNNQIQGKNIALLIGPSGAGKTTIMLRMLGYQMYLAVDNLTALKTLQPKKKIAPQHNGLISRPGAQSVTQTIFAAELQKNFITELQNLLICDTPGFFDSSGPVIDLVNGISLINAIKKAKSVKPVIVISANMVGQRLEGVKKLGKIVSNLLMKLDKNEEGLAITFIFNKFSSQQQFLRLEPGVKNILQNLSQTDKINTKYVRFLQLLHQTLFKGNKNKYILFKPFNFDIKSTIEILQENLIQNPSQVFQYSHSSQSIQVLQLFMKKKMQLINFYLEYNPKHSYFHLQQLKVLIDHLKIGQYENEYKLIKKNIEEKSLEHFTSFKYLLSQETWKDNISDGQIIESRNMYDKLMSLQIFREQKQCDIYSLKDFDLIIDSLMTVFEKIKNKIDKLQDLSMDERNITKKMQLFCKLYNLQAFSNDLKNGIFKRYDNITNQLEKLLKINDFQGYKQYFQQYKQVQKLIKLYDNEDGNFCIKNFDSLLSAKYQKISDSFKASLAQINEKLLAQQLSIFPEQINKNLILLIQIEQISQQLFSTSKRQRQQSIQAIKTTILKLQSDFKAFLKSKSHSSKNKMYTILANLQVIKRFQKLSKFVQAVLINIKEIIQTLIDDYKMKLTQIFQKLENGQICSSFSHIYTYIYALTNYPKLLNTDSKQNEVQRFIEQIQQDFMKYMKKIIQKTRAINTTLKSLHKNDNISIICNRLRQLKYVQHAFSSKIQAYEYFDDLKDDIEKYIALCKQKGEAPLYQIKKNLQNAKKQLDISSTIVKVCEDIKKYNQYLQQLGELLTNKINNEIVESIQRQKKQYFLQIHKEYAEEYSKMNAKYVWELSGEQDVSYQKRMSNLLYLQESARQDQSMQLLFRQSLQKIYYEHIKMLTKSIEYYSKEQKQSTTKNKLQIGQKLKKYEQYLDEQDKTQLNMLLKRYQNNEYEANQIQLCQIFSEKFLDYKKLQAFYEKNKESSTIAINIQRKIQVYDQKIYQLLNQIINNPPQIEEIDNHQRQLKILEHAMQLIDNEAYFNNIFAQGVLLLTDRNTTNNILQLFTNQFNNIFEKINQSILKIDFNPEQITKTIGLFEKLQKMIQVTFDEEYSDWKQKKLIKSINPSAKCLKNIPYFEPFPFYKYLQSLSAQIKRRRLKDITDLIDPKCSQSIKFYPSLNSQHQEQYLKPLLQQYQSLKREIVEHGRTEEVYNRQKQLIDLFPKQIQAQYREELNQIHSQRRNQLEQLSQKITIGLQDKQYSCIVNVLMEKKGMISQEHIAAVAQKIEQQYQQAQINDSDIGQLEQKLAQFDRNQQNLAGDKFRPIFSAISDGKNKVIQNLLKKTDRILKQIRQESPLMITQVKERKQLQNRLIQLVKANKIINRYKQFISNSTLQDHNTRISETFKQLINQYQSFCAQEIDKIGKDLLMDLIRSKFFMKNIFSNLKTFLKSYATSEKIKKLFLIQPENDWLSKFIKCVKQYQIKSYQFYQTAKIQFQKTNNQIILRENLQIIKNSFYFLINMYEVQQKIKEQEDFNFTEVIIRNSCCKQLKILIDQLFLQAQHQINNCKSIDNSHNLQKTIFFSQFLSLWEDQQHKKFSFIKKSSIQLKQTVITKLEYLIEQTLVYTKDKQFINSIKENKKRIQMKNIISPVSNYLNILILFQEFKQKITRYSILIKEKMNKILQQIPSLPDSMKIALNQELKERQSQPYISILCTNYKQFKHIKQMQFSQKTKVNLQQYLQKFFKENKGKKEIYKQSSNTVFSQSQKTISIYEQSPTVSTKQTLIESIKSNVSNLPLQKIIGKLFGLYSIIKKEKSCSMTYFEPHISQVIAIITLLKIDEDTLTLQNNLIQIPTGQGKSVVLGICACYLSLRGFQVYHSCYSPILIHRDKMEFWELYKQLKIQNKIFYGSFQNTCEKILPDQFKELAIQKIQKSNLSLWWTKFKYKIQDLFKAKLQELSPTKKVLLLDEVDVLLSPDYYNKLYIPKIDITDSFLENKGMSKSQQDLITKLFLQIYEKIKENKNFNFESIDQFETTQKIVDLFPQIKEILFHIMKQIIFSARNKSKIAQISQNKISFKERFKSQMCHSYLQLMAGVAMFKAGNISYKQLKRSLKIRIKLCELAYSELPKYFSSIIGASGTLRALSQRKKTALIQQYQMKSLYHLPSIYKEKKFGKQRLCFEKSKFRHLQNLTQIITDHLEKKGDKAVLVLFQDSESLKQYKQNTSFKKICQKFITNILILNKDNFNYDDVSKSITKTTLPNTVTLATKQFGRGIDFKDEVGLEQGLFVIIAYLPASQQEYLQAKGRTARAGKNGKVLLCAYEKEYINFQDQDIPLRQLFINKQQAKMDEIKDSIESVKLRHKNTLEAYTNNQISVVDYLEKVNKFDCKTIRIIVGIEIALHDRQQILRQFVDKIKSYLVAYQQEKDFQFQVKIFAYGNYLDLTRQMRANDRQKYGRIQSKSQLVAIDDILQFNKKIKKIEQNVTKAKGESVQLFFKYAKDQSKQDKKIDHIFLFCSKQNLSWNRYIQTIQYRFLQENKEFLENYNQKKSCIEYIKRFEDKTSLNIFCFNTIDRDVKVFYEGLKKQTKCIKRLQFISKEQFKLNVDLYCARSIGQTMNNIPNKK